LAFFNRAIQDERLYALGLCDPSNQLRYRTETFPTDLDCETNTIKGGEQSAVVKLSKGSLHVAIHEVKSKNEALGRLILVHDMSFVERRSSETKKYIFYLYKFT
jgi:hypothetical protein